MQFLSQSKDVLQIHPSKPPGLSHRLSFGLKGRYPPSADRRVAGDYFAGPASFLSIPSKSACKFTNLEYTPI